jgi:hypothetical protein
VDDLGKTPRGVVVVAVCLLAEDAAEVRTQCHLLVGGLGVDAFFIGGGGDDSPLLGGHLQAVGFGIVGAVVGQRHHRYVEAQDVA